MDGRRILHGWNSLVEGIACLPIMAGSRLRYDVGDVGLAEGVSRNGLCGKMWYNTWRYE